MSHPVWVRGLKLTLSRMYNSISASHPVWVRGLKLIYCVASKEFMSRTPCGCVD